MYLVKYSEYTKCLDIEQSNFYLYELSHLKSTISNFDKNIAKVKSGIYKCKALLQKDEGNRCIFTSIIIHKISNKTNENILKTKVSAKSKEDFYFEQILVRIISIAIDNNLSKIELSTLKCNTQILARIIQKASFLNWIIDDSYQDKLKFKTKESNLFVSSSIEKLSKNNDVKTKFLLTIIP